MARFEYLNLFTSIALFMLVIFIPWEGDNTVRFIILCVSFSLLSYFITERKVRRILSLASLLVMVLVVILGFGFSYFK
jgi:hypothetical protein